MKNVASLIFPHQLFENSPILKKSNLIALVEDSMFFGDKVYPLKFHKHKLVLHRSAMCAYRNRLQRRGFDVGYIDYDADNTIDHIITALAARGIEKIELCDVTDDILSRRIIRASKELKISVLWHETPMFLSSRSWVEDYFKGTESMKMSSFYIEQRRRLGILLDNGKPVGGKWSFDADNRKKLPKDIEIPRVSRVSHNEYVKEAIIYVKERFPDNPGDADKFWFPTTHEEAKGALVHFLDERIGLFGDYEDAISSDHSILFHSVLSPMLNCGLLTPNQVLEDALRHAECRDISLNSLEGFIRQLIGWREFMRAVYLRLGSKQRVCNFWGHQGGLPKGFYDASTGIDPLDDSILRVLDGAYCHHIERLMVLGNYLLLSKVSPDEVYKWFMEMFIDAYDWVMVPNVYGMSQYADAGMITSKPYISGSNYILKMSDYKKGDWSVVWDALFWSFIHDNKDFFASNPRLSMMAHQLKRMDKSRLIQFLHLADHRISA